MDSINCSYSSHLWALRPQLKRDPLGGDITPTVHMLSTRSVEERRSDVHDGIRTGLRYAAGFSVIATAAIAVGVAKGAAGQAILIWLAAVAFYLIAGALGGAVYGWLRPARGKLWGRLLTAYLILFLVYGGGSVAFYPLFVLADPEIRDVPLLLMVGAWAVFCLALAPVYVFMLSLGKRS